MTPSRLPNARSLRATEERRAARRTREVVLFVAGAAFGALVAFYSMLDVSNVGQFVGGILVGGVAGGSLSAALGCRFWEWLARVGPWLWP